ncbi:Mu transposase C-terminal domain-containing protein [Neptunicella sp. SCSIO 80796]|uniref:Mu transposase C-terminal domain-containing protein n=1 Tax=Neptunicella plasticusilytica TaxID=3117012 RepID=UPI003A4E1995
METFVVKDIANALGITVRSVQIRAKKESWEHELRSGRGGKIPHYYTNSLPGDVQAALSITHSQSDSTDVSGIEIGKGLAKKDKLTQEISQSRKQQSLKQFAGLKGTAKLRAETAIGILKAAQLFQKRTELPKVKAWKLFCVHYNNGKANLDQLREHKATISYATLARWEKQYNEEGITGLTGRYGKNKGNGLIDSSPEMLNYCQALIQEYPHIKGERLHELLQMRFDELFKIPSASTCRDWLRRWKQENQELFMSLVDPSGWQNSRMVAFGSKSEDITQINQLWEFDSTPADVMLLDGRYSIVGVIEVFTRRVKLVLKPTSNAEAIALLIRKAILDWGLPQVARTDNGSDYLSAHITSVWDALDIENDITNPYSGWEKPFIERFFRTFSHGMAELIQGYIGHNVAERQQISKRLTFEKQLLERKQKGAERVAINVSLTAEQFQSFIDQWVEHEYHHRKHRKLACTPFQKFTQHTQQIQRLDDERVLDVLLAPVPGQKGFRIVNKSEGIQVEGGSYIHPELGAYIGERVYCRWNPKDVGKIYVFHALHHHFICEAINPEIANNGLTVKEIAHQAKQIQRAKLKEQRKAFRKNVAKQNVGDVAQQYIDHKTQLNGGLNAFPKPSEQVSTNITQAAEQALQASQPKQTGYTEQQLTQLEQRRKELELAESLANDTPIFKNDHHKARYLTQRLLEHASSVTPVEKAWLHAYRANNKASARMLDKLFEVPQQQ